MKSKRKQIEGKLGAAAFRWALRVMGRKSQIQAERIGARWGRRFFKLSRKHRERALANLKLAFPDRPDAERLLIAESTFEHFGRTTADFLRSWSRSEKEFEDSMSVNGVEHLEAALAQGRGVLLITGHFGNWERLSAWLSSRGYPLSVIARDANDSGLNSLVNSLREKPGTRVVPRGNSTRTILERLKANELIGILPDQNSQEQIIPFFGHPAGTVMGPGVLHERTGAPVVCCWCVYVSPGNYQMWFEPALEAERTEIKGEGMMRAIHHSLEAVISAHPEQWLWFHDRWKFARQKGLM
ncbi:MAG TPA: lysophospholipid acyltransferase family protein [Fimbriimonadaceae bacterium]|nr:lysophospholipid acyltransferase family protein [Fimbriimonadaceae bacterium]HRJ33313.1 lysophospholipid acyltransferase family protein [Fimbriimonadaceae bacterium]